MKSGLVERRNAAVLPPVGNEKGGLPEAVANITLEIMENSEGSNGEVKRLCKQWQCDDNKGSRK